MKDHVDSVEGRSQPALVADVTDDELDLIVQIFGPTRAGAVDLGREVVVGANGVPRLEELIRQM